MVEDREADEGFATLLAGLRVGETDASALVFQRFVRRLVALAAQRLDAETRRLSEPEDVVQSAFRSFFTGVKDGEFALEGWAGLWGLLTIITLRKCRRHRRLAHARKRSDELRRDDRRLERNRDSAIDREPTPDEAAMLAEVVEQLLESLEPPERAIVELTLQGHDTRTIAHRLERSERTVQRVRQTVREHLEHVIADEAAERPK